MTRSFPPLVSVIYDHFIGEVAPAMTAALRAQLRDELPVMPRSSISVAAAVSLRSPWRMNFPARRSESTCPTNKLN
jgi:hypothetical protein